MHKILFVCHANCSRSPMAEFLFRQLVQDRQLQADFEIASAAATDVALGQPVDSRVQAILQPLGIDCSAKRARRITPQDYAHFDHILVMDESNRQNVLQHLGGDPQNKIHLLLDYGVRKGQNIADPWEHGDYHAAYEDIVEGIHALLDDLQKV